MTYYSWPARLLTNIIIVKLKLKTNYSKTEEMTSIIDIVVKKQPSQPDWAINDWYNDIIGDDSNYWKAPVRCEDTNGPWTGGTSRLMSLLIIFEEKKAINGVMIMVWKFNYMNGRTICNDDNGRKRVLMN